MSASNTTKPLFGGRRGSANSQAAPSPNDHRDGVLPTPNGLGGFAGDGVSEDQSELRGAMRACRGAFVGIALFSCLVNVLTLTGSLFMLEVYDRVLPSRSVPTLLALSALTAMLFGFQAILEIMRGRLLIRIGNHIDRALSPRIFDIIVKWPLRAKGGVEQQAVRDIETVRGFLSGAGPTVVFDLPWLPFYLALCFAFHPLIGATALGGAAVLVTLALLTELLVRAPVKKAAALSAQRQRLVAIGQRNAEAIAAMGMGPRLRQIWQDTTSRYLSDQRRANDITGGFGAFGRIMRAMLQSAVLAVGAYLVIRGEASAGIIIASSILTGRALAPVDLAIANWKGFVATRQSWGRLGKLLKAMPVPTHRLRLPAPHRDLTVDNLAIAPPAAQRLAVSGAKFQLKAGSAAAIIGPSASGKSSLARALVGIWPPVRGSVRLDGAAIDQWDAEEIGQHIGYLPQDVELLEGTIAQNIARFDPGASAEAVIAAAKAASVHDMIVGFPMGYETPVGEHGAALSAGQRQRVALARALYRDPFLIVLDEPNSNLDAEGEEALTAAILSVRARGGIAVIVAHRPSALAAVDQVLVMAQGVQQTFGPKDEVLAKITKRELAPMQTPLKVVQPGN